MARFQKLVAIVPQFLLGHILLAPTTPAFKLPDRCPVFFDKQRPCDPITPASFLPPSIDIGTKPRPDRIADDSVFADLLSALNATQTIFFAPWLGTWPEAIDWTAAVIGTHISGATRSISEDLAALNSRHDSVTAWKLASNLIDDYFAQTIAFYFGQNAVALRNEAYDDMLWVVLSWVEAIKFVNTHNDLHYTITSSDPSGAALGVFGRYAEIPAQPYHGNVWISTFAHRARIFWDLASHGWDTKLCDGGMLWNPQLLPYKNAITNELFIAASISMYLYFPGDDSQSSFSNRCDKFNPNDPDPQTYSGSRDPRYLKAAVESYRWLRNSNMTNARGLFVDGFHISGQCIRTTKVSS
ncbi:hypothetical protein NUW58_g10099 [Xylaria curta]|uniref:Uncharacterized protein n=1 Tax=Xylaria curta TaxID=42375 RepID=A0ACC1MRX2_9PEZI|nr:hypothetical protein NUW58_g10099 [Xylaria curta]